MSRRPFLFLFVVVLLGGCGGKGAAPGGKLGSTVDADPLSLLPGSAVVVANLDARAMYASASVGATLASFAESLVPLGADTGFLASRDVDRVAAGAYAANEPDVAVVLTGRFDVDKIAGATKTKTGRAMVRGTYAGFVTSTAGALTVAPLTARTLVAGTSERVHRVLDRIQQGKLERSMPTWAAATLDSAGAQFAVAADFSKQPIASATLGSINLAWIKGLKAVRAIGDFDSPGVNVAATLTYPDPSGADAAADGIRLIGGLQKLLAPLLFGANLQNLRASASGTDVSCKFAIDDQSLRALLALASRYAHLPSP
jgi:hypothetical protein